MSAFVAMTALKMGMKSLSAVTDYFVAKEADRANLNSLKTQIALNNQIATLNQELVNEDEIREMRSFGLDMAELSRQTVGAISGVKTSNPNAIGTRTGDALIRNVAGAASRARFIKELNFGTKLRSLNIERLNLKLGGEARNVALTKKFKPQADIVKTGLQIAQSGTEATTSLAGAPNTKTGEAPKSFRTTTRSTSGPRQDF